MPDPNPPRSKRNKQPPPAPQPPVPAPAPDMIIVEPEAVLDEQEAATAGGIEASDVEAEMEEAPPEPPNAAPPASTALAQLLGDAPALGRPTWLEVPPEQVSTLLALFADEGARLLAMTVLPPADDDPAPTPDAPPAVDLRYHFAVSGTPITLSTHTPLRQAPSAATLFPGMTWRERELAGEWGLRFTAADE